MAVRLLSATLWLMSCAGNHKADSPAGTGSDTSDTVTSGDTTDTSGLDTSGLDTTDTDTGHPTDADGDGYPASTDCDDTNATVHPGASEWPPDDVDQNCNGTNPEYATYPADIELVMDLDDGGAIVHPVIMPDVTGDGINDILLTHTPYDAGDQYGLDVAAFVVIAGGSLPAAGSVAAETWSIWTVQTPAYEGYPSLLTDVPGGPGISGLATSDAQEDGLVYATSTLAASGSSSTTSPLFSVHDDVTGADGDYIGDAGDIDGDGTADVWAMSGGSTYFFTGTTIGSPWLTSSAWAVAPAWDTFWDFWRGEHLDVDGDGLEDQVFVGGDPDFPSEGALVLYFGADIAAGGTVPEGTFIHGDTSINGLLPVPAGDIDGDGNDDLVVGHPSNPLDGAVDEIDILSGAALARGSDTPIGDAFATLDFGDMNAFELGDTDDDGFAELGVHAMDGAWFMSLDGSTLARGGMVSSDAIRFVGEGGEGLVNGVAVGDIDGDGRDDLVATLYTREDEWATEWGRVLIWTDPDL